MGFVENFVRGQRKKEREKSIEDNRPWLPFGQPVDTEAPGGPCSDTPEDAYGVEGHRSTFFTYTKFRLISPAVLHEIC